jgi:hypothetical protein
MAIPYALAERLGHDPVSAAMNLNGVLFAGVAVAGLWFARLSGLSRRQGLAVAGLVMCGTMLLPYASTGFSEPAGALATALGLVAIQTARLGRVWGSVLAGAASGMALLVRTDSIVLIVPVLALGTWLACGRTLTCVARFAVGIAPFAAVFLAYNHVRYGAVWGAGHYEEVSFSYPLVRGAQGLLISPGKGLLLYAPLAAIALVATVWGRRVWPLITICSMALLLTRVLFYARWYAWGGGWCWGPRFLVPAMPALFVGFVVIVREFRRLGALSRGVLIGLVVLSGAIQVTGAAVRYEASRLIHEGYNRPNSVRPDQADVDPFSYEANSGISSAQFDWQFFPIPDEAGMLLRGENLAPEIVEPNFQWRSGLLLLVMLTLGAWLLLGGPTISPADVRSQRGAVST